MRFILLLFSFLLLFQNFVFGQNTIKEGLQNLQSKNYPKAISIFDELLKKEPQNTALLYNRAYATLLLHQSNKVIEIKTEDLRFKNFQSQHDTLKHAYKLTSQALENYRNLSESDKNKLISEGIGNFKDVFNLKEGIAKASSNLIVDAFYYVPFQRLPLTPPYNRPENADTTQALRHILVLQATDFLETYQKTRAYDGIKNARRSLLKEFITIPDLRARGTGNGYLYEKYYAYILEDYTEEELRNIIPEFYGADWNFPKYGYKNKEEYKKLEAFAKSKSLTVLELFGKLNLHYKGVIYENKMCLNCDLYSDFINEFAPHQLAFVAVQKLASQFIVDKKWSEASAVYQKFKPLFVNKNFGKQDDFDKIIALLNQKEDNLRLKNLGKNINTGGYETAPVPFVNSYGNEGLYFCRMDLGTGQDVYYSFYENGKYSKAVRLPDGVNTNTHEVPQSVSFDGNTLVLFGNYGGLDAYKIELRQQNNKLGNGDLFFAERNTKGDNNNSNSPTWGRIKAFPFPVNTPNYEAGLSFSADGNAVVFSSDREGVIGNHLPKAPKDRLYFHGREEFNIDIFVSEKNGETGEWNEPINLGEIINTPFAETQPFLHPDMKTLYFVSDGHYGIGSGDIFMSKRLNPNSWTEWSEPVNLGKSINSPFLDGFYMGTSGEFAFIVLKNTETANQNQNNSYKTNYDIYRFEVPERFRPEPVLPPTIITGKLIDKNGKGIQTQIFIEDLGTGKIISSTQSSAKDGSFKVQISSNLFSNSNSSNPKIGMYAKEKGSFSTSQNISITTNKKGGNETNQNSSSNSTSQTSKTGMKDKPIIYTTNQNLEIYKISELINGETTVRLNNLFFDFDSYALQETSLPEIERLFEILKDNPTLKVKIEGHTDNTGKAEYNLQLSKNRAKAVSEQLISLGIDKSRVTFEGFGSQRQIADNFNDEGRAKNRRVEFRLSE
ncbi:outer membrane protein/peptidoglycan-associated (lipo)protein [Bernardetia litoralis DSM 6794]|uniref:Outer membrane protein/peptidoglycan-associated (Lipo)protein n=1 Tax=Bernardetia litoralis (strain ATCC 23117 / DSM 6794 / NBRC 15988 / NCIMB 1366 / Fx l1 / Sio-4) TaxID=880071 RepID=I4AIY9_BERLS|nr:OmpA family protein [Bernardetia litoralis]AFM03924.1 outer membrane protein/peptidoglycan-associated (lipo)protein [Bernardetia litoralis DSM 6794]